MAHSSPFLPPLQRERVTTRLQPHIFGWTRPRASRDCGALHRRNKAGPVTETELAPLIPAAPFLHPFRDFMGRAQYDLVGVLPSSQPKSLMASWYLLSDFPLVLLQAEAHPTARYMDPHAGPATNMPWNWTRGSAGHLGNVRGIRDDLPGTPFYSINAQHLHLCTSWHILTSAEVTRHRISLLSAICS